MTRILCCIIAVCALLAVFGALPAAAQSAPQVARLSLVTENAWDIDQATIDTLDDMVADALHMPFGGVMGWTQDVDEHDLFAAYDAAYEMKRTPKGRPDYLEILRMTAQVTDADLAVLPILETYSEEIYRGWDFCGETYLESRATVRLIVYDRQRDELLDRRVSRVFSNEYSVNGRAEVLACDAMRAAIDQVQLRQRVKDLRDAARSGSFRQ